ncbi:MAG: metallophosphoesterase family protein [Clostridia bacterium]|nr:metallophosphoesterase family protein [Clostridia bacterium]
MKKSLKRAISILLCFAMLFCAGISTSAADDVVISRIHCTVYGDTATQRGISWYTNVETDTQVKVYTLLGLVDVTDSLTIETECEEWDGNYMHKAYISGLTAGTTYTYKVGDGSNWETGTFTTDNGDNLVNFVVVADIQASSLENFEKGKATIEAAFKKMPYADFYANLGDFTNDSTNEEWDYYAEAMDAINATQTIVPVAGNHDSNSGWFNNMFALDTTESVRTNNGVNYSFDYGNVHVAVVNTNDNISISNAQLTWLENDMNSTDADWKIVFMHKSPYSLGKDIKWPDACYLQESLAAVCDKTNVDLVMSGHDHMYLRTKALNDNKVVDQKDGTTYVLAGTAGSKRYEFRTFILNNYFSQDILEVAVSQKSGYGNYWDGETLDNADTNNIGGVFNTVSVVGGALKLDSYVLVDETGELNQIDSFTIVKATGENTVTYTGENVQKSDIIDTLSSFMSLAQYSLGTWLGMFIKTLPDLISTYIETGTF